jgi:sulfoxide reductase heme-binding subunit YedZ
MRAGWKQLHRLVYPAAILAAAHWVLVAFDPTMAFAHAAVFALLLLLRCIPAKPKS